MEEHVTPDVTPDAASDPAEAAEPDTELPASSLDDISDAQALAMQAAEALAFMQNTPTMNMVMNGAAVRIVKDDDGDGHQMIVGPVFLNLVLPIGEQAGRGMARELAGGIEIGFNQADIEKALAASGGLHRVK